MTESTLLFLNLGAPEVIGVIVVILILFGGRKIPELARGLGKGIREFNRAKGAIEEEIKDSVKDEPQRLEVRQKEEQK